MKNLYINVFVHSTRELITLNDTELIPYLAFEGSYSIFTKIIQMPIFFKNKDLIENRPKKNVDDEVSLLGSFSGSDDLNANTKKKEEKNQTELVPHLKNNSYIRLVHDLNYYAPNQLPPQFSNFSFNLLWILILLLDITLIEKLKVYQPILDTTQFWLQKKDYIYLNETADELLNISITFNTYWNWKYMMQTQLDASTKIYGEWGMESNMEEMKEMLLETNIYLLTVTMIVSLLHSIFEILAMKNGKILYFSLAYFIKNMIEINFWKNAESHKGLSLRTLYMNLIMEVMINIFEFKN